MIGRLGILGVLGGVGGVGDASCGVCVGIRPMIFALACGALALNPSTKYASIQQTVLVPLNIRRKER